MRWISIILFYFFGGEVNKKKIAIAEKEVPNSATGFQTVVVILLNKQTKRSNTIYFTIKSANENKEECINMIAK